MSSNQGISLAYVIIVKNLILLQDLLAWNCCLAEFHTLEAMKIHLHEAQCDLLFLPMTGQMYDTMCAPGSISSFFQAQYQLSASPHWPNTNIRCNLHIQKHLISILSNFNSNFLLAKWDRLLTHAVITLNLLHSSILHPSLSSHASLLVKMTKIKYLLHHQEQK